MALLSLAGCVEALFFHPDDRHWSTPREFGLVADDVTIAAPGQPQVHGWFLHAADGRPRGAVLHVHGNAASIGNHLPLVAWLPAAGYDVLMFDYRGFGRSAGRPSLDGVVADTQAALAWLRGRPGVDRSRIAIVGQSLGGATALRVAAADEAEPRLHGLIIDSAFASYRGIARDAAGVLGSLAAPLLATLPGAAADPLASARRIAVPLLVMHGSDDRVIGIAHGEALFAAAPGPDKTWLRIDGGRHLDALSREAVRRRILAWLDRR